MKTFKKRNLDQEIFSACCTPKTPHQIEKQLGLFFVYGRLRILERQGFLRSFWTSDEPMTFYDGEPVRRRLYVHTGKTKHQQGDVRKLRDWFVTA